MSKQVRKEADEVIVTINNYLSKRGWETDLNFRMIDPMTKTAHYTITALDIQLDRDLGEIGK